MVQLQEDHKVSVSQSLLNGTTQTNIEPEPQLASPESPSGWYSQGVSSSREPAPLSLSSDASASLQLELQSQGHLLCGLRLLDNYYSFI